METGVQPPAIDCPAGFGVEDIDPLTKEACGAWERSLRPGQYFSEKGGHRPMRHRTQAVQGHPGSRSWPRGTDGGAWGPQDVSPIPSEKGYQPLVPSPTTSPGRRGRGHTAGGRDGFFPGPGDGSPDGGAAAAAARVFALADAVAAEVGLEGLERESLRPFEPVALEHEKLPPPPPAPPLESPWKAPPPGFDARTLRRQAATLRDEAAAARRDDESVRLSARRLAEILGSTVENGRENASRAAERLRCLYAALCRLRRERLRRGEAVKAAVAWQESLEELREKLSTSEERRRRAERAKVDVQCALAAAIDANRSAEAEVTPLERALEAAWRRDQVAEEMERQAQQEEVADAFLRRPRRCRRRPRDGSRGGSALWTTAADSGSAGEQHGTPPWLSGDGDGGAIDDLDDSVTAGYAEAAAAAAADSGREAFADLQYTCTSPLLLPTMAWGFRALAEACRRSRGMRGLAAARRVRAKAERRAVLREALAAWAVGAALERRGREARRRRDAEAGRLCFVRWRVFAALGVRFRAERRRRSCSRVMEAWRLAVREARRDRDLERRREALVLRRCFRGWRVLRAKSTLTPQEHAERCGAADRHRLARLFEAWHLVALASSASSRAVVRGVRRRRAAAALAAEFRAWASLPRARRWRRHRRLRGGLEALASFAGVGPPGVAGPSMLPRNCLPGLLGGALARGGGQKAAAAGAAAGVLTGSGEPAPSPASSWRRGDRSRRVGFGGGRGAAYAAAAGGWLSLDELGSLASGHHRRAGLARGLRGLLLHAGSAEPGRSSGGPLAFCIRRGNGTGRGAVAVVAVRAARAALRAWRDLAGARGRAEGLADAAGSAWRQRRLAGAVAGLRRFALAAGRRRRTERTGLLRRSLAALRQGCSVSRRQRSACVALHNALACRRLGLLRSAMAWWAESAGASAAAIPATAAAAKRRREREALEAAWRWWVGGWLRRQAEGIRVRVLEAERRSKRGRDLAEQLLQAQRESAALQKEADAVEKELERTKTIMTEQEEALVSSRRSLAEAAAAAAAVKARLGPASARGKTTVTKTGKIKGRKGGRAAGGGHRDAGAGKKGAGEKGRPHRAPSRQSPPRRRGEAQLLAAAVARREAAEKAAAERERATAAALGKLAGQEQADRAALEGALNAARRHAEDLERAKERAEEAGREGARVRAAAEGLARRVEQLARQAEKEATQGARRASSAESERAALSLGVSTAEARAREMAAILEEREREAAGLRQALAAEETRRREAEAEAEERRLRLLLSDRDPIALPPPPMEVEAKAPPMTATAMSLPLPPREGAPAPVSGTEAAGVCVGACAGAVAAPGGGVHSLGGCDVQELKESITALQRKLEDSRVGVGASSSLAA